MSNEEDDYDKQFQADLERAQALSLETLALEKFRMQKQLKQLSLTVTDTTDSVRTPVEKDRDEPTRSDSFKLKSRPRPGTLSNVQPNPIIAPPPTNQRKNSIASSNKINQEPDLISFTSPPPNSKLIDFHNEVQKISETTVSSNHSIPSTINQNHLTGYPPIGFHNHLTFGTPIYGSAYPQYSFQNGFGVPSIPLQTPDHMFRNQSLAVNRIMAPTDIQSPNSLPLNNTNFMTLGSTPQITATASSSTNLDVLKILSKQDNTNLIDLATFNFDSTSNSKASVLEAFDPLCSPKQVPGPSLLVNTSSENIVADDSMSVCSGSVYEEYYPFEYLCSGSGGGSIAAEPIYATINRDGKVPLSPPPLPPRASVPQSTLDRKRNTRETWINKKARLYENVTITRRRASLVDCDLKEFYRLVSNVRTKYKYNDSSTNSGIVISPMVEHEYAEDISIKLTIYPYFNNAESLEPELQTLTFTCNVSSSVEHVTLHAVCELDKLSSEKYMLKVWGLSEYLAPETLLSDYEYIHNCIKLEQDVKLCLIPDQNVDRSLARTAQDDKRDSFLTLTDLLPNEPVIPISHDNLIILLETLEEQIDRVEKAATEFESTRGSQHIKPSINYSGVVQATKAVCTLMGSLETPEITEALNFFISACENYPPQLSIPAAHSNFVDPIYAEIQRPRSLVEAVSIQCNHIRSAVQALIEMYCQAFRVDFKMGTENKSPSSTIMISEVLDWVAIRICALHRLPLQWKHDSYGVEAQVYHGARKVGNRFTVPSLVTTTGVNARILFNSDLIMEGVSFCTLARESRLVLLLYGYTVQKTDNNENSDESQVITEELGWASFQFFNYEGTMAQGSMLLSLWPTAANRWIGPSPCPGTHPLADHPVLGVELMVPHPCIIFPSAPRPNSPEIKGDFNSLDCNTQHQLLSIIEQDTLANPPAEFREVLWEKRHYLYHLPAALPKVLLAAHSWDWASLGNLHSMLKNWTPLPPLQALQLLLPCFPDMEVRRLAVDWIRNLTSDEVIDYLPQLVQALKHETYETSPLAEFLLEKSLSYPRVAHHLYWLLTHTLPGQFPQNSNWDSTCRDEASVCAARYHKRLQLMLRALLAVCGETLRNCLMQQQLLVKNLYEIAEVVKKTKESIRLKVLTEALESVHQTLVDSPNCLPLSPSLRVAGVQVRTCSYFPSNALPLKINFLAPDSTVVPAIFKVGDDLQQDMLTLQMVRIMDKLWLREGLDLKMVTFACVSTGHKRGMIEMVTNAETLRKIQVEWGLTGSFKDKPIAEWLAKHNPSELEYERARENFTASCAGYSVVTYILGICDRHNDNIMLKTSGHVFHIDFGKFLGDAQMFGNFKRDRTPLVLTSDMAFVINGGDRSSVRFHKFVDLCCQAFNIVRANANLILNLFTFMASSGIPGVSTEAISYVRNALLPDKSNPEAAALFARLIQSSLKSWFTQLNFFFHNIAQLRFTGDHGDGELLSFVPKTYTKAQEGRLLNVEVHGYEKRYDPDKYYVYILMVERESQPHPTNIFRTYKEFCELHQKLCLHFPLAKIHSLPAGIHMGRSNIKQVAEKRLHDIRLFIHSLFLTADEIAHSDLVYTFFHPMLRDQQNMELFNRKSKARGSRKEANQVLGKLKLTLHYHHDALNIMVHHVQGLPVMSNAQEPSTYVKVYLLPDHTKSTKRKTKVVKRNCHPSFMEMLEYRLGKEVIKNRILQATVWNHDPLQENEFLGGVTLDLSSLNLDQEFTNWFSLTNVLSR